MAIFFFKFSLLLVAGIHDLVLLGPVVGMEHLTMAVLHQENREMMALLLLGMLDLMVVCLDILILRSLDNYLVLVGVCLVFVLV